MKNARLGSLLAIIFVAASVQAQQRIRLSDALASTLAQHPALQLQEAAVDINRGVYRQAKGQFDSVVGWDYGLDHVTTPLNVGAQSGALNALTQNVLNLDVSSSRLLSNGITIGPQANVIRTTDNIQNRLGVNNSHLGYQVSVPLLRGRGRRVVAAQQIAAGIEVRASTLDVNHLVAQLLTSTAINYWSLVAAKRKLDVAADSEERGRVLLDNVKTLIEADRSPRSDMNSALANLADRLATKAAAEQHLIESEQQLALSMGWRAADLIHRIEASEDLPSYLDCPELPDAPDAVQAYADRAMTTRADLLASTQRIDSQKALLVQAKDSMRPLVSLNFQTGYSGLMPGGNAAQYLASPFRDVHGLDAIAGVSFRFSPSNNVAAGKLQQTEAAVRQAELRTVDVMRTIRSSIQSTVEGVRNAVDRVKRAEQAVAAYRDALDGEKQRYRMGLNSVVDILTVEDRLTAALGNLVDAQLGYAVAIANVRFAGGAIVAPDQSTNVVDPNIFRTLPLLDTAAGSR